MTVINTLRYNEIDTPPVLLSYMLLYVWKRSNIIVSFMCHK